METHLELPYTYAGAGDGEAGRRYAIVVATFPALHSPRDFGGALLM